MRLMDSNCRTQNTNNVYEYGALFVFHGSMCTLCVLCVSPFQTTQTAGSGFSLLIFFSSIGIFIKGRNATATASCQFLTTAQCTRLVFVGLPGSVCGSVLLGCSSAAGLQSTTTHHAEHYGDDQVRCCEKTRSAEELRDRDAVDAAGGMADGCDRWEV